MLIGFIKNFSTSSSFDWRSSWDFSRHLRVSLNKNDSLIFQESWRRHVLLFYDPVLGFSVEIRNRKYKFITKQEAKPRILHKIHQTNEHFLNQTPIYFQRLNTMVRRCIGDAPFNGQHMFLI